MRDDKSAGDSANGERNRDSSQPLSRQPTGNGSTHALDPATGERKRDSQPLSRQPTGNGSVRGASVLGSVKGEPKPEDPPQPQLVQWSVRGDRSEVDASGDHARVTAKATKSAPDDAKSFTERVAPSRDAEALRKLND